MRVAPMLLAACLLAAGNAASASRTGLLQLLVLALVALIWGWWRQHPARWILLSAGAGYAVAALTLPLLVGLDPYSHGIFARVAEGAPACSSRMTLWANVAHLVALKPWAGWGWGELDYAHYATLYGGQRFCDILDHAHNLPMHLAVELGLPAALLISGALLVWLMAARPWREQVPSRQLAWLVLGFMLLHSMLEYPLWYGPFQLALGLCIGWLSPWKGGLRTGAGRQGPSLAWQWRVGLAAAAVIAVLYAAWQYQRVSQIYTAPAQRTAWWRDTDVAELSDNWLFLNQVRFAELTTTPLTRDNAERTAALAQRVLHYSPEPRVIEPLIESLALLERDDEALWHLARYRAAFEADHRAWRERASPASTR